MGWKEFTKHTGIKIAVGSGFTIFLNMDNESFKKELQFNKDDAELISKLYQTAWQFLAVGMYHRMDQQKSKAAIQQNDEKEKTIEEKVAEASEGIAMVLVPIITKLAPQAKRQISTEVS